MPENFTKQVIQALRGAVSKLKKYLLCVSLLILLGGCQEFSGADYLPYGHPADPASSDGKKARMSRSLTPQNEDIRPDVSAAAPPQTVAPGTKPASASGKMDHSAHRGSY